MPVSRGPSMNPDNLVVGGVDATHSSTTTSRARQKEFAPSLAQKLMLKAFQNTATKEVVEQHQHTMQLTHELEEFQDAVRDGKIKISKAMTIDGYVELYICKVNRVTLVCIFLHFV